MDWNFSNCLAVILQSEGGYTVDQGGPTMLGVTQRELSSWLQRPAAIAEVKALTAETVAPIYKVDYWTLAHCDACAVGIDLMVFDEAVNEGPGIALRHLQAALGVAQDGRFGPVSLAALQKEQASPAGVQALIRGLHDDNAAFYEKLASHYPQDEHGWLARNDRTQALALAMAAKAAA